MANKKKRDPEYTLNIFHHYDEKTKYDVVVFLVQTTKIFVSFRYEILINNELNNHSIHLKIIGLHVPELLMPQSGPAQGKCEYKDLHGLYKLTVTKQDKTINEFSVQVSESTIDIKHKPRAPFIIISSDPVNLSS